MYADPSWTSLCNTVSKTMLKCCASLPGTWLFLWVGHASYERRHSGYFMIIFWCPSGICKPPFSFCLSFCNLLKTCTLSVFFSKAPPPVINITLTSGNDETLLQPINSCWGRCTDYTSNLEVFIKNPVLGVWCIVPCDSNWNFISCSSKWVSYRGRQTGCLAGTLSWRFFIWRC